MSKFIIPKNFGASRRVRGVVRVGVLVVWFATACLSSSADGSAAAGLRPAGQPGAAVPTNESTSSSSSTSGSAAAVHLGGVDSIIQQAIADGLPGAVLVVGHDGQVIYRKAYGNRALEPAREAMTLDTVFDLASLTKVIATTTAVMQLVEQGKVRMNDPVAKYLPEFAQNGKDDITVRQLLTHYSGLEPDLDLKMPWEKKETAYAMAFAETLAESAGLGICLQRHQFYCAGGADRARVGGDAGCLYDAAYFCAAEDDADAVCASGGVARENCADAV